MTLAELLGYMNSCRSLVQEELARMVPSDRSVGPILYDLMLEYPLREAKALRPAVAIAVCRALGGPLEGVLKSATVLELYHNAFLIHDDVEDGSELRRDAPTLHQRHGVPVAVNVGDAMLALALKPLLENTHDLGLGKALRIMQAISVMARESAEGQAVELDWIRTHFWNLHDRDYLRMVHKKTSWYTFITPTVIGGIVGGCSAGELTQLRLFATALGTAFQIQDDVLNLTADEHKYGKERHGDLWEGKRTLILMHALRAALPEERERALEILTLRRPPQARQQGVEEHLELLERLRRYGQLSETAHKQLTNSAIGMRESRYKTEADIEFLVELIERHHSVEYARRAARRRALKARSRLNLTGEWVRPSEHVSFLHGLVDFVVERDH